MFGELTPKRQNLAIQAVYSNLAVLILLIVALPLLLLLMIALKVTAPSQPVFQRWRCAGFNNIPFTLLRFNSRSWLGRAIRRTEAGGPAATGKCDTRRDVAGGSPAEACGVRNGTGSAHSLLCGAPNGSAGLNRLGSDPFPGCGRTAGAGIRPVLHSQPVSRVRPQDYYRIPADALTAGASPANFWKAS